MYIELYRQYTKTEMVFDDANTRALRKYHPSSWRGMTSTSPRIDWREYFMTQHLPAVTDLTKVYSRAKSAQRKRTSRPAPELKQNENALAVFDLDGTVLATNIVQQILRGGACDASSPVLARRDRWPARRRPRVPAGGEA